MSSHTASSGRLARRVVAAIVSIAVGVPAAVAQTISSDREVPSVTVRFSDLNLATPEGLRILYQRLVYAAQKVCPQTGYVTELHQNRAARSCIADSVDQAVKQIRNPQLAQVAASQAH